MNQEAAKAQATLLASYAASVFSLFSDSTAASLSINDRDIQLWREDVRSARMLFTQQAILRLKTSDVVAASLWRSIAKQQVKKTKQLIAESSRYAALNQPIYELRSDSEPEMWPNSPLTAVMTAETADKVLFTPYHFKAASIVELVRISGSFLGDGNGDSLATRFMKLILFFGGITKTTTGEYLDFDDFELAGGFAFKAKTHGQPVSEPLAHNDEYLAITILAAWIRMSTLGSFCAKKECFLKWRKFLSEDGYGVVPGMLGSIWSMSKDESAKLLAKAEMQGSWASPMWAGVIPWHEEYSGAPNLFVGIASHLFEEAIAATEITNFATIDIRKAEEEGLERAAKKIQGNPDREIDLLILGLYSYKSILMDRASGCIRHLKIV